MNHVQMDEEIKGVLVERLHKLTAVFNSNGDPYFLLEELGSLTGFMAFYTKTDEIGMRVEQACTNAKEFFAQRKRLH